MKKQDPKKKNLEDIKKEKLALKLRENLKTVSYTHLRAHET